MLWKLIHKMGISSQPFCLSVCLVGADLFDAVENDPSLLFMQIGCFLL
jgi:hypothetical protein